VDSDRSQRQALTPRPERAIEIQVLRRLTPEQRLNQVFKLNSRMRLMLKEALRRRHPNRSEAEIHQLYLKRLARCQNRT
jgi:hypothetical protein